MSWCREPAVKVPHGSGSRQREELRIFIKRKGVVQRFLCLPTSLFFNPGKQPDDQDNVRGFNTHNIDASLQLLCAVKKTHQGSSVPSANNSCTYYTSQ